MKAKTSRSCCMLFVTLVMFAVAPLELSAKTLGMVADNETDSVTVFDADTHAVLGTVVIDPGDPFLSAIGDVLITPDLKRGFVTNRNGQVFVIDLTTSPPSLAGGTNPIPISTLGNDLSISSDGKFLVVSNGTLLSSGLLSVIDIATQTEISTFSPGAHSISVDVCSDSSVLVTTIAKFDSAKVRRLTLSGTGTLTDTGEVVVSVNGEGNVYCAPGARSGVTMSSGVTSFTIPGLSEVDTRPSPVGNAISGAFNQAGNRLFVRGGAIDVFAFNPTTGALGASPLLTFSVAFALGFSGIDLHPNGGKLFVSEPSAVNVYDPTTGALLASITDPNIVEPTGVTVVTEANPCALPPPQGAIVGTNGPDLINGTSGNDKIFGLGGNDQINGGGGNDLICGGAGNDQLNGNAGNDTIVGGSGVDQINGGSGTDQCTADPGDTVSSCNP